jgi:hypothetical protein
MRIDSSGNARIGYNNSLSYPSDARLMVSNAGTNGMEFSNTAISGQNRILNYNRSTSAYVPLTISGSELKFDIGGSEAMRIDASDNVGIGVTNPSAALDVVSNSASGYVAEFRESNASNFGTIVIDSPSDGSSRPSYMDYATGGTVKWSTGLAYNDTTRAFHIGTGSGLSNSKVTITTGGNVGIGTGSPLTALHIENLGAGSANFNKGIIIKTGDNSYTSGHGPMLEFRNEDVYMAGIRGIRESGWQSGLQFFTHSNSSGNVYGTTFLERMRINGSGNVGIGTTSPDAKLSINADALDQPALVLGNVDGGGIAYVHRNNRYLLSNGSNWIGDGKDPIAVIGTNSNTTNKFPSAGLVMHNESQTDNTFSTPIVFGNKSNSGAYNTAYAYIAGRKNGQGVDSNWSTGELWIDTAGTKHNGNDAYMDHSPAIKIRNTGTVDMRWQPFSYGTLGGNNLTNNTGWQLSPLVTQGLVYNNNATHGYGLTVAEPGYYMCYGTSLYAPGAHGYVYIGWALNGSVQHHWHSNHSISSNHDWVSSMIRWCNAGDHLTIEGANSPISATWGGGHSQYYVWKMG